MTGKWEEEKFVEKEIREKIIQIRRHLHQYPELSTKEYKTAEYIASILKDFGLKVETKIGGNGVVGLLKGEKPNVYALRADMDALPIKEETKKPYASKIEGVMHACGHDGNMAIVLGALHFLAKKDKKGLPTIKFIFQPAEEEADGAKNMIKENVLKNPEVEKIFGVHVSTEIPTGKIGLRSGEMMAGVDKFSIILKGTGGHAAYPQDAIDPIPISALLIEAIQNIVSRKINPFEPVVISIGKIQGGTKYNVLAQEVIIEGTVRTLNSKIRKKIKNWIFQIVGGICESNGIDFELDYEDLGDVLINDPKLIQKIDKIGSKFLGKENIVHLKTPSLGGEDFSEYLKYVNGAFIYIGCRNEEKIKPYPWHHPCFDIDEEGLIIGAEFIAHLLESL